MRGGAMRRSGRPRTFLPAWLSAWLLALAVLAGAAQAQPAGGKRVALVVGNGAYTRVERLENPLSDARLMASTLAAAGFELIGGSARTDLSKPQFDRAVQEFGQALPGAEVALFYYSGHGMQVGGTNWLVPVDASPAAVRDLDFQMVDAGLVLRQMEGAGTKLNLLVLDACRNNPFAVRGLRAGAGGLAEMRAPEGTLISYATQPGNVAADGTTGNSPYTAALARAMHQPGLDVFQVFNQVGLLVKQATGGQQQPWVASSPIAGSFRFFDLPAPAPSPATTPAAAAVGVDAELVFWQSIVGSISPADYQAYLRRFPNGTFAELARRRIEALSASAPPPASAAQATLQPARPMQAEMPWSPSRFGTETDLGRWTTRNASGCSASYYTWRVVGDTWEFQDQAGQVDSERVLDQRTGGATTETVFSRRRGGASGQPVGTRWEYRILPDGRVRVQNVSSGSSFVLTRCPG